MNFTIKILIISSIFFSYSSLKAQRTEAIYGTILNQHDSIPIINAHIFNINSKHGVVSNDQGIFSIAVKTNDTLRISIIGFETQEMTYPEIVKNIYLKKKNYDIETFTVIPYKDFKEFKQAFTALQLKDDSPQINESIFLTKEELRSYDGSRGIVGGFDALLGHFNKYVQDKKNYERLIKQDKYEALLAKKFNPELVKRSTELTNKETITLFMDYCDFTNYFIESASEYELAKQIIDCYQEFSTLATSNK